MPEVQAVSAYGPGGASTRVRVLDWLEHLGVSASVSGYAGGASNTPATILRSPLRTVTAELGVRRLALDSPRLLLSREASPLSRGGLEERLLRAAPRGVFDFDDAIYLPSGRLRRALNGRHKVERCVRAADVVVAGNETLAHWASERARDVRLIPSCVDPERYLVKDDWELRSPPTLVWLGSPSTEQYLGAVVRPLLEVNRRTGARLVVISGTEASPLLAPLAPMLTRVPWRADTAASLLREADVAIAPLDDTEFARGKCAYKLLQYAAAGLPMVGSPVGANAPALTRFAGLSATSPGEWTDALLSVLDESAAQRARRGEQARAGVETHYSFRAWEPEFRAALGLPR